MKKNTINLIGKILMILALLFVVFRTGNECVIQNEGGTNWGGCGLSGIVLVVVVILVLWGFKRVKNDELRKKSHK